MGSGKILKLSIKKNGIENFTKEILEVYDNPEDMFSAEAKIVNEEFIKDKDNYNLKEGGQGGFDWINENVDRSLVDYKPHIGSKVFVDKWKNDPVFRAAQLSRMKEFSRLGVEAHKLLYPEGVWKGKFHNEESKKKIGKANSIHQTGKGNSQFGTRWIHNLELKKSKKVNKEEPLPEGWLEGRKIKF